MSTIRRPQGAGKAARVRSPLVVRSKVWFEVGGRHVFGEGLARLLEGVASSGTLRKAALDGGMSYRYAWGLVRGLEKNLESRLVLSRPGGPDGGGTELTDEGRGLLALYRRVSAAARAAAARFRSERTRGGRIR